MNENMNQLERQTRINDTKRYIDFHNRSGSHEDCIRININNTMEHEIAKLKKCFELKKEGIAFLTEVIFDGRKGIADIVDLVHGIVYEIVNTETEESIIKKINKYPFPLEVIRVG